MRPQVLGHQAGVVLLALEAHGQALQPLQQQKGVQGGQSGALVAQADGAGAHGVGPVGEVPGVDHAVEGGLGPAEHGEAFAGARPRGTGRRL